MKIIAISAYMGSGKDSIINKISEDLNIPIIISHSSRPPRNQDEIINNTYYFVDNDFFDKEKDNFIETREYYVANGELWKYGIHKSSVKDDVNLVIVDPQGLQDLISYFGESSVDSFHIDTSEEVRLERLKLRGDDESEIARRILDDKLRFRSYIESGNYHKIDNNGELDSAVNQMEYILIKHIL